MHHMSESLSINNSSRSAIVLLSGGLDSATTLAIAVNQGFTCHALSFDYGQRHDVELECAKRIADQLGAASHQTISLNLRDFGGSALTDDIDVPKNRDESQMVEDEIPVTYVPARNTIFLSYALALGEIKGCGDIFIGVNAVDYSGYPDCRPAFIHAFEKMANLATKAGVNGKQLTIHTPLIQLPKTDIIERGLKLGVDYGLTHSCYDPDDQGRACGCCDSCILRKNAFEQLGTKDPVLSHLD
ncbi:MAG TPA: 7-cyano-7-deazaguanine synthase QueC [Phycisphaerales bacterium]|nr:7-cyano-7-deazaguanine synthase QueC [Phycisphaerales bacterium]|tara:strand:+ start:212 stop:940 length:729 start_codon:yes stop_codon:yes gene_type:complete